MSINDKNIGEKVENTSLDNNIEEVRQELFEKFLSDNENLEIDNISTWSTELQDKFMSYLTTNYGEQFLTSDTMLSRLTEKQIVGYDVDFDSNTITFLVKGVMAGEKFYTGMHKLTLSNATADDIVEEFLINNAVSEASDAFSENEEGQIIFNGKIIVGVNDTNDIMSITALEGKFGTTSGLLGQISTTPTASYYIDELNKLRDQYNTLWGKETGNLKEVLYVTRNATSGINGWLGHEGLDLRPTIMGIDESGRLVVLDCHLATEYAANSFLDLDPTKHEYVLVDNQERISFGGKNAIIRLEPIEAEASLSMEQ